MLSRQSMPRKTGLPPGARLAGRGFTMIELMIAVVVAAILASLALPAFFESVRKGRRSEAFAALAQIQQAQERWRAGRAAYATQLSDLGLAETSSNGLYRLSITSASAVSYQLQADATGSQVKDSRCASMVLLTTAGTISYGSACAGCTLTQPLTDSARCWSRE
jgi:type IV pilus assembly protein PilE